MDNLASRAILLYGENSFERARELAELSKLAKKDGFGHAVDLYPYYNGAVQVSDKEVIPKLKLIAVHIKAVAKCLGLKITWGGDWKTPYDPPHFELS